MRRISCLLLSLSCIAFASVAFAQSPTRGSAAPAPKAATEVVYVIDGSTLATYNVDPTTLKASRVGTLTLPESVYPGLVTSPDGRFLYYTAYKDVSDNGHNLYVYDTNASGVPGANPVQKISAGQRYDLIVHPSGNFLYSVVQGPTSPQFTTPNNIVRAQINPQNGKLGESVTEASYTLDSSPSGNYCYLGILGFNPAGTAMYDVISCSGPHGSGSATYNERAVDVQTGALGPDKQVYYFSYYAGSGSSNLQFEGGLMFAFIANFNQGSNANFVDVYQLPSATQPVVHCTYSMLAACGDFILGLAHRSGKYVFLTDTTNVTEIGAVNLSTQEITGTGSIPYEVQQFSPDGTIAYAANDVNTALDIEIYGFNAATGAVTQGGTISVPSDLDSWFTATRY